jgi:hypothetical protein
MSRGKQFFGPGHTGFDYLSVWPRCTDNLGGEIVTLPF